MARTSSKYDVDLARAFVAQHGNDFAFLKGRWIWVSEGHWHVDTSFEVERAMAAVVRTMWARIRNEPPGKERDRLAARATTASDGDRQRAALHIASVSLNVDNGRRTPTGTPDTGRRRLREQAKAEATRRALRQRDATPTAREGADLP